jgi:hypothetical protein
MSTRLQLPNFTPLPRPALRAIPSFASTRPRPLRRRRHQAIAPARRPSLTAIALRGIELLVVSSAVIVLVVTPWPHEQLAPSVQADGLRVSL